MKLRQIIESEKALSNLIQEKLPALAAMDLKVFILEINNDIKSFYEVRDEKIKEYGEDLGEGKFGIKDPEKIKEFAEEMEKLLEKEIEVTIPEISNKDLTKAEITTQDLITLNWLIK